MNNITLSIIIPIGITYENTFRITRLKKIITLFSNFNKNIELVIVNSSKENKYTENIYSFCKKYSYVKYNYLDMPNIYSASKARNKGVKNASGEYILFFDVDLIITLNFIVKILKDIEKIKSITNKAFEIYPCLYLSESKTKKIEDVHLVNLLIDDIKQRYLEGYNDEVLYLAVNTSTILVQKKHFLNIGAYDENYKGHGYEDFELIHRLYMAYPIIERGLDYTEDHKTVFPAKYRGFRKYFAYYSLHNFFKGTYTLHLWHPRPLNKKYYKQRKENAKIFLEQLTKSIEEPLCKKYIDLSLPTEFTKYIVKLYKKYNIDEKIFLGLFSFNPLNVQTKNTFQRKLRKLFFNPKLFFIDIKFKK